MSLEIFYHRLPIEKQPRILGLTASPLINVKQRDATWKRLEAMLSELKLMLDSKLASFSSVVPASVANLVEFSSSEEESECEEDDEGLTSHGTLSDGSYDTEGDIDGNGTGTPIVSRKRKGKPVLLAGKKKTSSLGASSTATTTKVSPKKKKKKKKGAAAAGTEDDKGTAARATAATTAEAEATVAPAAVGTTVEGTAATATATPKGKKKKRRKKKKKKVDDAVAATTTKADGVISSIVASATTAAATATASNVPVAKAPAPSPIPLTSPAPTTKTKSQKREHRRQKRKQLLSQQAQASRNPFPKQPWNSHAGAGTAAFYQHPVVMATHTHTPGIDTDPRYNYTAQPAGMSNPQNPAPQHPREPHRQYQHPLVAYDPNDAQWNYRAEPSAVLENDPRYTYVAQSNRRSLLKDIWERKPSFYLKKLMNCSVLSLERYWTPPFTETNHRFKSFGNTSTPGID